MAIDTPRLWQQMNINLKEGQNFEPLLTLFFTNSRDRNLDISVRPRIEHSWRKATHDASERLLKFIALQVHRCEKLSGHCSIEELRVLLSSSDNGNFETYMPFLKELDLTAYLRAGTTLTFAAGTPALFSTLWTNLTVLRLKDIYFILGGDGRGEAEFLEYCPNLEFLLVGWTGRTISTSLPQLRIKHEKLRHLELRLETSEDGHNIHEHWTTHFHAPNLKHLSFTHPPGRVPYQCQNDAKNLVNNHFGTSPERISAVFLPACVLLAYKTSMVRCLTSDLRDHPCVFNAYKHKHCSSDWLDQPITKLFRGIVNGSPIDFKFADGPPNLEDIRSKCQDCCYEESRFSGMLILQ